MWQERWGLTPWATPERREQQRWRSAHGECSSTSSCFAPPQDRQMPLWWWAHGCDSSCSLELMSFLSQWWSFNQAPFAPRGGGAPQPQTSSWPSQLHHWPGHQTLLADANPRHRNAFSVLRNKYQHKNSSCVGNFRSLEPLKKKGHRQQSCFVLFWCVWSV